MWIFFLRKLECDSISDKVSQVNFVCFLATDWTVQRSVKPATFGLVWQSVKGEKVVISKFTLLGDDGGTCSSNLAITRPCRWSPLEQLWHCLCLNRSLQCTLALEKKHYLSIDSFTDVQWDQHCWTSMTLKEKAPILANYRAKERRTKNYLFAISLLLECARQFLTCHFRPRSFIVGEQRRRRMLGQMWLEDCQEYD